MELTILGALGALLYLSLGICLIFIVLMQQGTQPRPGGFTPKGPADLGTYMTAIIMGLFALTSLALNHSLQPPRHYETRR